MALMTECPSCKTCFKIVPDQLRLHHGLVRCGSCDHVFNANNRLEALPEGTYEEGLLVRQSILKPDNESNDTEFNDLESLSNTIIETSNKSNNKALDLTDPKINNALTLKQSNVNEVVNPQKTIDTTPRKAPFILNSTPDANEKDWKWSQKPAAQALMRAEALNPEEPTWTQLVGAPFSDVPDTVGGGLVFDEDHIIHNNQSVDYHPQQHQMISQSVPIQTPVSYGVHLDNSPIQNKAVLNATIPNNTDDTDSKLARRKERAAQYREVLKSQQVEQARQKAIELKNYHSLSQQTIINTLLGSPESRLRSKQSDSTRPLSTDSSVLSNKNIKKNNDIKPIKPSKSKHYQLKRYISIGIISLGLTGIMIQALVLGRYIVINELPVIKPVFSQLCSFLKCTIEPALWIKPLKLESFTLAKLSPQSPEWEWLTYNIPNILNDTPKGQVAYRLQATLHNDSALTVQTPDIELTLKDLNNQDVVAQRVLTSNEVINIHLSTRTVLNQTHLNTVNIIPANSDLAIDTVIFLDENTFNYSGRLLYNK